MSARIAGKMLFLAGLLVAASPPARAATTCESMSKAVRAYVAARAPRATAAQAAHYGLHLPPRYDPGRPLVVLIHGLDCDKGDWSDMRCLLERDGRQVATFHYPSDQRIADSAALFGKHLTELRHTHPQARVDVVAHSMGGLVARAYVEGDAYAGGVDRLILIGTPNAGSTWGRARLLLELQEHYDLWRHDPDWRPSWMITDGLGEAGRDLRPGSAFLRALNARPRRQGVKYTIVAGTQSPVRRVTADSLAATSGAIKGRAAGWWGFRQCKGRLSSAAGALRDRVTGGDGPVTVKSVRLDGVDDVVLVQADHASLFFGARDVPPAAWGTVRDRLSH